MNRKIIKYAVPGAVLLTAIIILSGCFFSAPTGALVTPEIRAIGLPDPSIVGSITLKVTGPGMDPVEVSYQSLPSVINMAIPEGNDRTFELTVQLSPAFTALPTTTYTSFKGTATADINADGAVVTLNMGIGSTKIVVPDAYNHRIVQINDMTGAGWATMTGDDLSFADITDFMPYDVDIDQSGNIYVANYVGGGTMGGIYVFNSINFRSTVPLLPSYFHNSGTVLFPNYDPIIAVAVDKKNNRIYGVSEEKVYYWEINNPLVVIPFFDSLLESKTVNGITVDIDGNVYLSGSDNSVDTVAWIGKYSAEKDLIATYTGAMVSEKINDITILNGELYATNLNIPATARIEKYDPANIANGPSSSYGSPGSTGINGQFVGPYNFVATMNKKLTIIDSDSGSAQLVSMDDILGTNWRTFGSYGMGTNEFWFFNSGA